MSGNVLTPWSRVLVALPVKKFLTLYESRKLVTCSPVLIRNQINLLKTIVHVMHHQFNIKQFYILPSLYIYVLYLFKNKQRLVPLRSQTDQFL
jgi:hypothetical protein